MAFRLSNSLLGILNFITLLLSAFILGVGIWISRHNVSHCERYVDKPIILIGSFLIVVSLAGFIGACCGVTPLLWVYLVVMFILIVLSIAGLIISFVVTRKGGGQDLPGKSYKEYRLGDYSKLLRNTITGDKDWSELKSCFVDSKICEQFRDHHSNDTVDMFYKEDLRSVESGCCKPSNDCQFTYVGPTNWTRGNEGYNNTDCNAWSNDVHTLCFNCDACKAGFIESTRNSWKKAMLPNIIFVICIVIIYSIGCCAFRNNRKDKKTKY